MYHVVFVHGVSVRKIPGSDSYDKAKALRHKLFSKHCFRGSATAYYDPYWGGDAADLDLDGIFLDMPYGNTLGGADAGEAVRSMTEIWAERLTNSLTPAIAIFLGDAFVYFHDSPRRERILEVVRYDLIRAAKGAHEDGGPLVLVGHSQGANILYDILSVPQEIDSLSEELGFRFQPDLFLSVGTQLGLFEELNLFKSSRSGVAPRLTSVKKWWHVYNRADVLSFAAEGIFEGVEQFSIDTGADLSEAHGSYFDRPIFFQQLRKQLEISGLVQ
ncbi:hypothetical protein [Martelella radicis]|uniref:Uncharacterized protein n=1 Tax=Martelella radicis TaxID=1397476 RepID=A0A7W6P855_9HYPH|nr:hypothetical protein [Martelella radicis]MBB4120862.1 hypothetical protein [Martelella radicis]